VTGHSRGAAVANLFAADLNQKAVSFGSTPENIFCYAFATPNNSTAVTKDRNIFNFCFTDDFVPRVPLVQWGYGKYGRTSTATAQTIYANNSRFAKMVDNYSQVSNNRRPSFDAEATDAAISAFNNLAPNVDAYYTREYRMSPDGGLISREENQTMHGFMRNYIGNAAALGLADMGSSLGAALKRLPMGNDVKAIADFFIEGWLPPHSRNSINDTHQAFTYYTALKTGGFPTPK